jgi:cyclophilin family peptidyl-prolyl cis-trans isomerase
VALAEGNMENKVKPQGTPYYDGLKFHRVISDFMIKVVVHWEQELETQGTSLQMNFMLI